ncbi:NADH-quinone oxidoreductase subunit NuoH [Desulfosoma caldarium]|uniref:NADH-quinone oxidoreductase subunit H n=1 Tax=Desulfosoma caldarium TaxID=610254 RepID=A0A3N1UQV2_9BACT|nr:NADH-quinone oxidoreductase subunit NuoH [Desulfosoma caldarium]ROQ90927.1 NADH-quinone oxidoreductase subunit H [Desulfosoma caldarium]
MAADLIESVAKILFIFGVNVGVFAPILGWVERKQSAVMQDRIGANRADILGFTAIGLFHSLADAIKLLTKEDFVPDNASKFFHTLAPFISLVPAIAAFAIVPFGGRYELFGREIHLVIADLDVGILYVFALAGLATYGTVLAGWSSRSNWSLLGGLRASAQMLSYEVAMGLSIIGLIMVYGTLKLTEIGAIQENFFRWGIFLQPVGFIIFMTCAIAENKRIPFDIPEAESELVAGYFTEYSGMKFIMFWMAEFLEMVTISAVVTTLFFGAWHIPFVTDAMLLSWFAPAGPNGAAALAMLVNIAVFFAKVSFFIWLQMTIRWTLPRFRYDQVMRMCWKMLLPLSLINLSITGLVVLLR